MEPYYLRLWPFRNQSYLVAPLGLVCIEERRHRHTEGFCAGIAT